METQPRPRRALVFDVGNTHVKLGFAAPDAVHASYSLTTDVCATGDLWGLRLLEICAHAGIEPGSLTAAAASSVVPGLNAALRHACGRFLGLDLRFIPREISVPLTGWGEHGHELGADRLLGCFAARALYPDQEYIICIDYGTATTFDCIRENAYLGGVICPGVLSSAESLSRKAAQLPGVTLDAGQSAPGWKPGSILARSTQTHLTYGFLYGFAGLTKGIVERMKAELGAPALVVATGGFAAALAPVAPCIDHVRPDLLLDGGRLLLQHHRILS